ncbi:MAG: NAD(P)/FAD-dependent oxidoreductase [Ignavibacteriae bacterium]|nr:NAD(P)/FAD-dependent oxidoreductase [Ignavibacteriota bacterium]
MRLTMKNKYDVIVIGAGPAGITAAIQLKRFGISTVIIEKESNGGLLKNAGMIENYPGFPEGITGIELIRLFNKHLEKYDIEVNRETALSVDFADGVFSVKTDKRKIYSKYVIAASGTRPIKFCISGVEPKDILYDIYKLPGEGLSKTTAVIGGGDAAFDYALNLHSRGYNVIILNRGDKHKCIKTLWNKFLLQKKVLSDIRYLENAIIEKIKYEDDRYILEYTDTAHSHQHSLTADYILAATGREPADEFLKQGTDSATDSEIENAGNTLLFAGDVKNGLCRQAIIAAGDGMKAAMLISNMINNGEESNI